jgi:hypothetical protein
MRKDKIVLCVIALASLFHLSLIFSFLLGVPLVDPPSDEDHSPQGESNARDLLPSLSSSKLVLSPECLRLHNTSQFESVCQEHFLSKSSCQKLSDAKVRPILRTLEPRKIQNIATTCKTLWITGMSLGFESKKNTRWNIRGLGYQYAAALRSAQDHAGNVLQPMLIIMTPPNNRMKSNIRTDIQAFTAWVEAQGVIVVTVNQLSFQDMIFQAYPEYEFNGVIAIYLRFDIPKILRDPIIQQRLDTFNRSTNDDNDKETTTICTPDIVFYTDCDVLFVNPLPYEEFHMLKQQLTHSKFLMYGQDFLMHRPKPCNTGIAFMHLAGFEQAWENSIRPWGQQRIDQHLHQQSNNQTESSATTTWWWFPPHDQDWLNYYYIQPKKWKAENLLLPPTWNWKIYWQLEEENNDLSDIRIVHFHGPKPNDGMEHAAGCDIESIFKPTSDSNSSSPLLDGYQIFVASSICCDHGKTSHRILQLYEKWKPTEIDFFISKL